MGFGDNANFEAVPAFGQRGGDRDDYQGQFGGDRRNQGRRGGGGGFAGARNFSDRRENRKPSDDWEPNEEQESRPSRGGRLGGSSQFPDRGRPQGEQRYERDNWGQKFGDSRPGFGGFRRSDDESRPGDFNQYRSSNQDGRGGDDRRGFNDTKRPDRAYDGGRSGTGRGMYCDEDPVTRDRRAGFGNENEDDSRPPNRRNNDFGRYDRDGGRENSGFGGHDDRRRPPDDIRGGGYGGGGRRYGNANDGNDQEYDRRDGFGMPKGNFRRDEYEDREPSRGFGGNRRGGPMSSGFGDSRRLPPRAYDDRSDDFDNSRERGNDQGRPFSNRKSSFDQEDRNDGGRRFNDRSRENEGNFSGRRNSPDRRGFGERNDYGPSGRGGRFSGESSSRGGRFGQSKWNDNEDDGRGRRGNGFKSNGGFGNKNASGFGGGDDYSKGGDQQGVREFYSSGSKQERAPKDWSPENTAIEKLFERDAINAAHFENERDESVQIIGEDNNVEISSWENSGLHPDLIKICTEKCHYKFVRPIQAAAIPLILSGRDVMGLAETGGGKTAAFVLPILHQIMNMGSDALSSLKSGQILALVVAPTRELARQLYDSFRKHAFGTEVNCCVSYGELPRFKSLSEIHKGCHVLVGTSGRLMDFVKRSDINVERLRFLVLDEADMLLESGRENHLTAILSDPSFPKPESRQTLLFSATFPADVERLAGKVLRKKYVTVRTSQRGKANVRVTQKFVQAEGVSGKNETLFDILEKQKGKVADDGSPMRTLVFVETKKRADFLALALSEKGVLAASINGDRPQNERERVVGELREGTLHVLVGTDVCQRGLDIGGLDHVINYDMPTGTPEEARDKYIHRIGRTGRLHGGVATTFVDSRASSDVDLIKLMVQVARETDQEIPDWLDQMCNRDSFARAGFDSRSTFGAKGFGSSSGFGATGFGSGGSGGFGTGGFKDAAKSDKQGNEDAKEDKELGSASFGDGGFGNNKKTEDQNSEDGSY